MLSGPLCNMPQRESQIIPSHWRYPIKIAFGWNRYTVYVQYFYYRSIASHLAFSHDSLPATSCSFNLWMRNTHLQIQHTLKLRLVFHSIGGNPYGYEHFFGIFTLPNPLWRQATGDRCLNSPLSWPHHTDTNKHQQKHRLNDITCITCCVTNAKNSWSQGFSCFPCQNIPISSDPGESHGDLPSAPKGGPLQPVAAKMEAQPRRGPAHRIPNPNWNAWFLWKIKKLLVWGGYGYNIFETFPDLEILYQPPNVLNKVSWEDVLPDNLIVHPEMRWVMDNQHL